MDLNDNEREQVTAAVAAIHSKGRTRVIHHDCRVYACGLISLVVICFAAMFIMSWTIPAPATALWWLFMMLSGLVFVAVIQGHYLWRSGKLKHLLDQNRGEQWLCEIDQIEVSDQERQLFLRLIVSLYEGPTEGFLETVAEALKSPALSRLTFLHEMKTYLRVK